jgi:hypothetical protein
MDLTGLPYAVTPMTLDDVYTVSEIERNVFTMPWSSNAFRYEISHNRFGIYLVLRYRPWVGRAQMPPRWRCGGAPTRSLDHRSWGTAGYG